MIAIPLILSTGMWSVQQFIDRIFLTWYSAESIAAAMPAGILNFTLLSFFLGTAGYVSTFIAQYFGAKHYKKIGSVMWQGIYIALIGGLVHLLMIPAAGRIFHFIGHDLLVQQNEIIYFKVLCTGAFPAIATASFSGFYSGRGKTWPVLWITLSATVVNIVLDYILIFGNFGFKEMGIMGAGLATVISAVFSFFVYILLISKKSFNEAFNTLKGWRFNFPLFKRVLKYGLPNGIQFFIDIAGFTFFILMIGRLGIIELAATNIAFNINSIAFMPMIGFGITTSVLVGQYLGKNDPATASKTTYAIFRLTFLYMTSIALLYLFKPDIFLKPFSLHSDFQSFTEIRDITVILLRFVAFYSVFDTFNIIFSSAIKGAGDTRFVMITISILSFCVLVIPNYLFLIVFKKGLYFGWAITSIYIILLGFIFFFRFLKGKWKTMKVIEEIRHDAPKIYPEIPTIDFEA